MLDAISDFREQLKNDLEWEGDWRSEKPTQDPRDHRKNQIAAKALYKMARGVDEVPDELVRQTREVAHMYEDFNDVWRAKRKIVRFGYMPETAEELLKSTISACCIRFPPHVLRGWIRVVDGKCSGNVTVST